MPTLFKDKNIKNNKDKKVQAMLYIQGQHHQ